MEYIFKWRNVHFSHLHKAWGNFIQIESSQNPRFGISTCLPFSQLWGISNQAKIQVPEFKASLFKSSCCNLNKILSFIQLTRDREGLYYWQQYEQVPLTFIYEEATQESCRNIKCNMSTISFHNMDASKIYWWTKCIYDHNIFMNKMYLWPKYIYDQNISMTKIYLWPKYIYGQNISMTKIYLWVKYILNINMNHDF